jgi:acyl dehydratase
MTTLAGVQLPPITRVGIARYAGATGDFNPVHVDEDFARSHGLPSVIAHGPFTVTLAIDSLVAQGIRPRRLSARLQAPVFPDQRLSISPTGDGSTFQIVAGEGVVVATVQITLE